MSTGKNLLGLHLILLRNYFVRGIIFQIMYQETFPDPKTTRNGKCEILGQTALLIPNNVVGVYGKEWYVWVKYTRVKY